MNKIEGKKLEIPEMGGSAYTGAVGTPPRPFISQNYRAEKSSKDCLNRAKFLEYTYFLQFSDDFFVWWIWIFFCIASLKPWFKYTSFNYKEAYFSVNFIFNL